METANKVKKADEKSSEETVKLNKRLKELRKLYGLTQEESARKLNISRSSINNYEAGTREPDYDTLIHIAKFYGVTVDYLIGYTNEYAKDMKDSVRMLLQTLNGATDEEIDQARKIIEALRK